jgi:hypothetical protein
MIVTWPTASTVWHKIVDTFEYLTTKLFIVHYDTMYFPMIELVQYDPILSKNFLKLNKHICDDMATHVFVNLVAQLDNYCSHFH